MYLSVESVKLSSITVETKQLIQHCIKSCWLVVAYLLLSYNIFLMENLTPTVIDGRTAIVSLFDFSHYFLIVLKANDIQGLHLFLYIIYILPLFQMYFFIILLFKFCCSFGLVGCLSLKEAVIYKQWKHSVSHHFSVS